MTITAMPDDEAVREALRRVDDPFDRDERAGGPGNRDRI